MEGWWHKLQLEVGFHVVYNSGSHFSGNAVVAEAKPLSTYHVLLGQGPQPFRDGEGVVTFVPRGPNLWTMRIAICSLGGSTALTPAEYFSMPFRVSCATLAVRIPGSACRNIRWLLEIVGWVSVGCL